MSSKKVEKKGGLTVREHIHQEGREGMLCGSAYRDSPVSARESSGYGAFQNYSVGMRRPEHSGVCLPVGGLVSLLKGTSIRQNQSISQSTMS